VADIIINKPVFKCLLFLSVTITCNPLFSQKYLYCDYKTFDAKDGYVSFLNSGAITRDNNGLIWIAGNNGLYCFDGVHFKNYRHNPSQPNSLPFNTVYFNYQDKRSNYWVYVLNKGLFRFNLKDGSFALIKYANQNEFDINQFQPQLPFEDKKGNLWFPVANYGIAKWNYESHTFTPYKICPEQSCGSFYSTSWVTHIIQDFADNTLWLSSNDGLIHFFPHDGHYDVFKDVSCNQPRSNVFGNLYFDSQQNLWICTWGHGLKKFNVATNKFEEYRWSAGISGTHNICTAISPYDNDHLWITSYDKGFMLFNVRNKTFTEVRKPESEKSPLGISQMLRTGDIFWATNDKQFFRITPYSNAFSYHLLPFKSNLKDDSGVFSFLRIGDTLFYGTLYNGHFGAYDLKKGINTNIHLNKNKNESVLNLSQDGNGVIWIATPSGIYLFNPKTKDIKQLIFKNHRDYEHLANCILHDRDGTHWIASAKGLIHYNLSTDSTEVFNENVKGKKHLRQNEIYSLFQDKADNIWFGSSNVGLGCYKKNNDEIIYFNTTRKREYPEQNCTSITGTQDGTILFVLEYLGFCVLENPFTNKEKLTLYTSADGLPSDYMQYVYIDNHNRIWLYTANGICLVNPSTKKMISFNMEDGLSENNCSSHPYQDTAGNMYIGFTNSFQTFKPDSLIYKKPKSISILLTGLWINGKEWPVNPLFIKTLQLDHTQSGISFDFAAISPTLENDILYAYRMEKLEDRWTITTEKAHGQYTNLPPGNYQLHIKAASRNGEWYKQEYFLSIIIHSPWYKTWWFFTLIALAVGLLLYGFYRYRINQTLRLERMRADIASDLHDDIGSTLTSISYYSEAVKMQLREEDDSLKTLVEKIGNSARNMVTAMSDIVWVINPANDTTFDLVSHMKTNAAEMLMHRNIVYNFRISDKIGEVSLNMQQRRNLYLIYKEALHNAVKYAQCNEVQIDFLQTDQQIILNIKDNGRGFNIQQQNKGNGLQNMQQRADEIKAKLAINSEKEKGTCVSVSFKIT
jgi:ligand-binding sensor domain-containing protein/two-component sensor histidine kinase